MYRTIVEERPRNIAVMDVFSKLVQERIIFIDDVIDEYLANGVIAQMMYLDSLNNDLINVYINSPGGQVYQGLAIYDVSKIIKSPIRTIGVGVASSMAAVLLLMGQRRTALPNCRIMFHETSGGHFGKFTDVEASYKEHDFINKKLMEIIETESGIKNAKQLLTIDKWYSVEEAIEEGILNERI